MRQKVVNDFVIPSRFNDKNQQHKGRHFQIWFDLFTKQYYIRDLGIGFGVFKKMNPGQVVLKDNMLVNIGEAYIVVSLHNDDESVNNSSNTIRFKMFGGPNNGEIYEFNSFEMLNGDKDILIGRTSDCSIKINDKLLSKIQCTV